MRRPGVSRRVALAGLGAAAVSCSSALGPSAAQRPLWRDIAIMAAPLPRFSKSAADTRFGTVTFLGGLVLTSADRDFGGLSGLAMEPDGRSFIAVSDEGTWLTARLTLDGARPTAIEAARIGSIVGADGAPYGRKRDKDCEAVALLDGGLESGTLLMAFERNHRIERFPVRERIVQAAAGALAMPRDAARMDANKGLEAMTVLVGGPHAGRVVAFAERLPDVDGNHTGWLWIDGVPQRIGVDAVGGFDITDAAALPDGSLLLLERRFRWTEGVKMQLRLIAASQIEPGRVAIGRMLLTADDRHEIDNMEGLSAHRNADGTTILTLISDDNFNRVLQRTVLLRFALDA